MSEGEPPLEHQPRGKYGNHIDETLYVMSLEGWANESSGDVEAPTGWFARISINEQELPEVVLAFMEDIQNIGLDTPSALLGHWLLRENSIGFVDAEEYDTEDELKAAYDELDGRYGEWLGQDEPDTDYWTPERRERIEAMTVGQVGALVKLCARYSVTFDPLHYAPSFDLPSGWVAGWIGGQDEARLYVGVDTEGQISS